jgi:hypothetical protein
VPYRHHCKKMMRIRLIGLREEPTSADLLVQMANGKARVRPLESVSLPAIDSECDRITETFTSVVDDSKMYQLRTNDCEQTP